MRAYLLAVALAAGTAAAQSSLVDAAREGERAAVLGLLAERANPNEPEADGTTALHWAVHHDDAELVTRLLAAGANVAAVNDYGATPMSEAAVMANPAVLEALLAGGADVDSPNAEGQTALMVVARGGNTEAARLLLDRGADVNARETRKGQTALMWAVAQSHPAMVRLLLERGAEVDARSTVNDWERMVTAEPRQKNLMPGGFTPLLYAARQGCRDCAAALLDAGAAVDLTDPDGVTPLNSALLNAHWDTAKLLLERGANPNKWDFWGRTPLYAAVDFNTVPHGGRPDRPSLDDTTSLAMIEILLAAGANPNAQLKLFPPYRSLRMDRGADSILDIGTTPLLRAARGADVDAIERLVAAGALLDLPQRDGITPLMAAVGAGASPTDTRGKFRTELEALETAEALLAAGAKVDATDARGRTALHYAAAIGYTDVALLLAEHGADLAAADSEGFTPLDAANGKLRGRGRGPAPVHTATVKALEALLADTASSGSGSD
jgi:ankyrin repeat protein